MRERERDGRAHADEMAVPFPPAPAPRSPVADLVALTPAGLELICNARETHLEGVAQLFSDRYSDDETAQLMALLERLPV